MKVTKQYLEQATSIAKAEIQTALQIVYDALNKGQQQKLLKNEEVKTLLLRYDVLTEGGE